MSRPTKYTPETVERLCEGIRLGLSYAHAAEYAGIGYRTFHRWMEEYRQFRQTVLEANGQAAALHMARLNVAAKEGDWRASAWILEHRWPDQYGNKVLHEFGSDEGKPIKIVIERVNKAVREEVDG